MNPRPFVGLPRHMLRRLAALDLVRALLDSLAEVTPEVADARASASLAHLAAGIERHRDRAFRLTVGGERLDLAGDDKASGRYRRAIESMGREITASWPRKIDASAFIACVLAVVAQADEQLPRTPAYMDHRAEWGRLHSLLAELYATFDPDYLDAAGIERGSQVGERMVTL